MNHASGALSLYKLGCCCARQVWAVFDPDANQTISAHLLPGLVLKLPPPMGLQGVGGADAAIKLCYSLKVRKEDGTLGTLRQQNGKITFAHVLDALVNRSYVSAEVAVDAIADKADLVARTSPPDPTVGKSDADNHSASDGEGFEDDIAVMFAMVTLRRHGHRFRRWAERTSAKLRDQKVQHATLSCPTQGGAPSTAVRLSNSRLSHHDPQTASTAQAAGACQATQTAASSPNGVLGWRSGASRYSPRLSSAQLARLPADSPVDLNIEDDAAATRHHDEFTSVDHAGVGVGVAERTPRATQPASWTAAAVAPVRNMEGCGSNCRGRSTSFGSRASRMSAPSTSDSFEVDGPDMTSSSLGPGFARRPAQSPSRCKSPGQSGRGGHVLSEGTRNAYGAVSQRTHSRFGAASRAQTPPPGCRWGAASPGMTPVAYRAAAAAAELRAEFQAMRQQQEQVLATNTPISSAQANALLSSPLCASELVSGRSHNAFGVPVGSFNTAPISLGARLRSKDEAANPTI